MATTAGGTPYVESSDLVANYPAVSLALAEHIDDVTKVLQVVRATDTTTRSTSSTSFVDVTGMSVTITPQKSTSTIFVIATGYFQTESTTDDTQRCVQITNSSNTALSGAEECLYGTVNITGSGTRVSLNYLNIIGYSTPATTSPTTYKLRFKKPVAGGSVIMYNASLTGQMIAFEVSA